MVALFFFSGIELFKECQKNIYSVPIIWRVSNLSSGICLYNSHTIHKYRNLNDSFDNNY